MRAHAAEIAKALGHPERRGRKWRADCPLHGGHSLELADGDVAVLAYCFGGCDQRDVLRELRRRGLMRDDGPDYRPRVVSRMPKPKDCGSDERIRQARAIWSTGSAISGTKADIYLRNRGLVVSSNPSLRFVSSYDFAPGVVLPAMLAAIASPARTIIGVQVTFLRQDGSGKAQVGTPRRTYGTMAAGAVRLAAVDEEMGIAEGTESALAALAVTGIPTWACLGSQRMHQVELPVTVKRLSIFADNDDAGLLAAERTQSVHTSIGTTVRLPPPGFKDWNDALLAEIRAA